MGFFIIFFPSKIYFKKPIVCSPWCWTLNLSNVLTYWSLAKEDHCWWIQYKVFISHLKVAFFTNEEYNLDIFEITNSTSKPSKELMNKELVIFQRYEIDAKNIKHFLQQWEKDEIMFLIVGFFAHQILRIIGSQIEMETIFSLV